MEEEEDDDMYAPEEGPVSDQDTGIGKGEATKPRAKVEVVGNDEEDEEDEEEGEELEEDESDSVSAICLC